MPFLYAVGNGTQPLYTTSSWMARITLNFYLDCGTTCTSPVLEHSVPVGYQAGPNPQSSIQLDRWGLRPVTVNTRDIFTKQMGRITVAQDRGSIMVTGYDQSPEVSAATVDTALPSLLLQSVPEPLLRLLISLVVCCNTCVSVSLALSSVPLTLHVLVYLRCCSVCRA